MARIPKPRPPTYEQLQQMYETASQNCDLARLALQATLHERPAARTTTGDAREGKDGKYTYRVYRPDAPSGGILILTFEKHGQAPYSAPYWWENWRATESWVFGPDELQARGRLTEQLTKYAALSFDEGAEGEHAAAELGEDGKL